MLSKEARNMILSSFAHPHRTLYNLLHLLHRDFNAEERLSLRERALLLPDRVAECYREEIRYLEQQPEDWNLQGHIFPYERVSQPRQIEVGFCEKLKLPYVVHKGRRLYFPQEFSVADAERLYRYYVEEEGILGTGIHRKSPHQYCTSEFRVEEGDIVVDIGCSEALFAFDNIDAAGAVYMFEAEKRWGKPLTSTFSPWLGTKAFVHNKFVGGVTAGHQIRLLDVLPNRSDQRYFIKMDIEGGERDVLESCRDFLTSNKVKLCCCLYHRHDDEKYIVKFLTSLGYNVKLSDGFVLIPMNGIHYPYFRRCLARAQNY